MSSLILSDCCNPCRAACSKKRIVRLECLEQNILGSRIREPAHGRGTDERRAVRDRGDRLKFDG